MSNRGLIYGLLENLVTLGDPSVNDDILTLLARVQETPPGSPAEVSIVDRAAALAMRLTESDRAQRIAVDALVATAKAEPTVLAQLERAVEAGTPALLRAIGFQAKPLALLRPGLVARAGVATLKELRHANLKTFRHLYIELLEPLLATTVREAFNLAVVILETELEATYERYKFQREPPRRFPFRGSQAGVERDYTSWSEHVAPDARRVAGYLAEAAMSSIEVADLCRRELPAAFWAALLSLCSEQAENAVSSFGELIETEAILGCPDTWVEAARFLEAAFPFLGHEQQRRVVHAISRVDDDDVAGTLGLIPPPELLDERLSGLRAEGRGRAGHHRARPQAHYSPFDPDEWLREQGAEPSRPSNALLLRLLSGVEQFGETHANKEPQLDAALAMIPTLLELKSTAEATKGADEAVLLKLAHAVGEAANAVLRCDALPATQGERLLPIVTALANHAHPPSGDGFGSSDGWGSPAPRIVGAAATMAYARKCGVDASLRCLIEKLAHDPNEAVRFQVFARSNGLFGVDRALMWSLLEHWVRHEQKSLRFLSGPVSRIFRSEPSQVSRLLATLWARTDLEQAEEIRTDLSPIVAYLACFAHAPGASATLDEIFREADRQPHVLARVLADLRLGRTWLADNEIQRNLGVGFLRRVHKRASELLQSDQENLRRAGIILNDEIINQVVFSLEEPKHDAQTAPPASGRFFDECDGLLHETLAVQSEEFSTYMKARLLRLWIPQRPDRGLVAALRLVQSGEVYARSCSENLVKVVLEIGAEAIRTPEGRYAGIQIATRLSPFAGTREPDLRAFRSALARSK